VKLKLMVVFIMVWLIVPSTAIAQTSSEDLKIIAGDIVKICVEKLTLENIPINETSLTECGAQQVEAIFYNIEIIQTINDLPEGELKQALRIITVACYNKNKLPSGRIDYEKTIECLEFGIDALDDIITQELKNNKKSDPFAI